MRLDWKPSEFLDMVGRVPEDDDMERLNCSAQGEAGHSQCGYCKKHNQPISVCGCFHYIEH